MNQPYFFQARTHIYLCSSFGHLDCLYINNYGLSKPKEQREQTQRETYDEE